jgi:UDP-glucose-4-epimerase GalE
MRIFVTGGAGYVGSHCIKHLCNHGHQVVTLDNLSQGHRRAVDPRAKLIVGDLGDRAALDDVLQSEPFDGAMHFAASALVGESAEKPLAYYRNNTVNTLGLLEALRDAGVNRLVFSSTCATYGTPERVPISEDTPQHPINPYGRSKLAVEWMLADSASAWGLGACALRYFNACGAADDGSIGEDHDPETHLIPIVLQVALAKRPHVTIFGSDYDTPDGTCLRDYIHVEDLADAHRLAIEAIEPGRFDAFNVGTGTGYSVQQIIEAARRVTGRDIRAEEGERRVGDPPTLIADGSRIRRELGWQPTWTDIDEVIGSAWRWAEAHPNGFDD